VVNLDQYGERDTLSDKDMILAALAINMNNAAAILMLRYQEMEEDEAPTDHRTLPRKKKKKYNHDRAKDCLYYDYLGPEPLFSGLDFQSIFCVSCPRFQSLMEGLCNHSSFWHDSLPDAYGNLGASSQCKILLPLKCLAFGVPVAAFLDYFRCPRPWPEIATTL